MSAAAPTILMVACEESGDNYGAKLAGELLRMRPDVRLVGLGGPKMREAGVELLENMLEHSATGLAEVASSIGFFVRAMKKAAAAAREHKAQVAVLIDSPDFNLRLAPKLKAGGTRVAYYVSPQMWAWRGGRVKQVRRHVDEMLVIFPFERDWYAKRGVEATFVGHPMLDIIDLPTMRAKGRELRAELLGASGGGDGPLIGLLPGSRRNEIERLLPRFLEAARLIHERQPGVRFALGCSRWLTPERAQGFLDAAQGGHGISILHGRTHELMAASDLLLACSGTATMEAALIGTPLVMAYRLSASTYWIAKLMISRKQYFCMPNIILGKEVAPELIQGRANPRMLADTALMMLPREKLEAARVEFAQLEAALGGPGASARAAERVAALLNRS